MPPVMFFETPPVPHLADLFSKYVKINDSGIPSKSGGLPKLVKQIDTGSAGDRRVKHLNIQKRQVDWTFVLTMFFVVCTFQL